MGTTASATSHPTVHQDLVRQRADRRRGDRSETTVQLKTVCRRLCHNFSSKSANRTAFDHHKHHHHSQQD